MIEWRSFFGPWKEVTLEQAKQLAESFKSRMCVANQKIQREQIQKHLRGITIEELDRI